MRDANIAIIKIMENREQQILSEIRQTISSVRAQLDALEEKLARLSSDEEDEATVEVDTLVEVEEDEAPIDLEIPDVLDGTSFEPAEEQQTPSESSDELPDDDLPFEDVPVSLMTVEEDLPAPEILIDAAAANVKPAVIDAMTAKQAWRTDIPGSSVKDIRSAISLHDRILFINGLFDEDPMLFQEVLTAINSMSSVDDVVEYLAEKRPEWDMDSDEVYRFMMAVRRRIQ